MDQRAMKKLGMTGSHLLDQCIAVGKNGTIQGAECLQYWVNAAASRDEAASLLNYLAVKLPDVATGLVRYGVTHSTLLTTIHFLCYMVGCNGDDKKLQRTLRAWEFADHAIHRAAVRDPQVSQTIQMIKATAYNIDMTASDVTRCCTLVEPAPTMAAWSSAAGGASDSASSVAVSLSPASLTRDLAVPSTSMILMEHFRSRVVSDATQTALLLTTIVDVRNAENKMGSLRRQHAINPELAEQSFLALRHMLLSFIAYNASGAAHRTFLQHAVTVLRPLSTWPAPAGLYAHGLALDLRAELRSPGTLLLASLHREARFCVDSLGIDAAAAAQLAAASPSRRRDAFSGFAPLFYFADDDDEATSAYLATMCVQPHPLSVRHSGGGVVTPFAASQSGALVPPPPQQCGVIVAVLHAASPLSSSDVKHIHSLSDVDVAEVYDALLHARADASGSGGGDCGGGSAALGRVLDLALSKAPAATPAAHCLPPPEKSGGDSGGGGGGGASPDAAEVPTHAPLRPTIAHLSLHAPAD